MRKSVVVALVSAAFVSGCSAPLAPTPVFTRAEVAHRVDGGSACAACVPRAGERVEGCHLGSLEPSLLARREALGDLGVRRDAMVCMYRREP